VTATDLVLHITEMLRKANVVGKFVEFHGEGAATLSATDRATIGNMAPEYGATIGFFPVDEETCRYFAATGRSDEQIEAIRSYFTAQGMFGMPRKGETAYSMLVDLDLTMVSPSVAGPRRPQDRIDLPRLKDRFRELLHKPVSEDGYNLPEAALGKRVVVRMGVNGNNKPVELPLLGGGEQDPETMPLVPEPLTSEMETNPETEIEMMQNRPTPDRVEAVPAGEFPPAVVDLGHGDVVIAAITSCTNTSNPSVMLAAGLLARKAVENGLSVRPAVKTSLAPGSRVVTEYLQKTGLQRYLDELGFRLVGYGCTSCIGSSGPLEPHLEETIANHDLVVASVLSGNRNFEARVHQSVKANFLMSPPLVVAFALAGRVDIDLSTEPIGKGRDGQDVYLRDIWPAPEEVGEALQAAFDPETYRRLYRDFERENPLWVDVSTTTGKAYEWETDSTYIQEPPYFEKFSVDPKSVRDVTNARALAIFGDSVTTDHISPASAIQPTSPAGLYLQERGVAIEDFNGYGARRGNHHVMTRGTFANVRIKNLMCPGVEGGVTIHQPDGSTMSIYDAAMKYQAAHVPLLIFAGREYGTGSSRDWAAKGTRLLGVKAVIAQSFERIHRSNLVGMGVLPCQFREGVCAQSLHLDGTETFDLHGFEAGIRPRQELTLVIHRCSGDRERSDRRGERSDPPSLRGVPGGEKVPLTLRIDTSIEVDYFQHGGILPYVLRQLIAQ
jgi:aconitate hydratase